MAEDDDNFIMEEFEWALKDPTEEKLRQLGEVVSIITGKLVDAIGQLENRISSLEENVSSMDSRMSSMSSRASSVGAEPAAEAGSSTPSPPTSPNVGATPGPVPANAGGGGPPGGGGGGMTMMGELKALLAARRKKVEGGEKQA